MDEEMVMIFESRYASPPRENLFAGVVVAIPTLPMPLTLTRLVPVLF